MTNDTVRGPMDDTILPIKIREDLTIFIQGIPWDLKPSEGKKIIGVIKSLMQGAGND